MFHYTYLLLHKTNGMRYIGVRSSKVSPLEDFLYWGSSRHIPSDVKKTHIKIILKEFSTRQEAVEHEILLHNLNDVAKSPFFYNKAKQTSSKFDTSGIKLSEEHKEKCRKASTGKYHTEETKAKLSALLKGRTFSENTRKQMSESHKILASKPDYVNPRQGFTLNDTLKQKISLRVKELECNKGTNNNKFVPWFISYPTVTHLFYGITKKDKALQEGLSKGTYQNLCSRSKGIRTISKGKFKDCIVGDIPTK